MSHAPSLLFLTHLSTTSLSTSTPVRPSIRPSTRPSLPPTSHEGLPCADPSHVSFGSLAETHSPARSREMKTWPMKKTVLQECTRTFSILVRTPLLRNVVRPARNNDRIQMSDQVLTTKSTTMSHQRQEGIAMQDKLVVLCSRRCNQNTAKTHAQSGFSVMSNCEVRNTAIVRYATHD